MPLFIKDDTVDHMAEQLRLRIGARTKTDAVRMAIMHELERVENQTPLRDKLAALQERARERLGAPVHDIDMKKLMDELWEEGE